MSLFDLIASTLFGLLSALFWISCKRLDAEFHPGRTVMAVLSGFFFVMSVGVLL